MIFRKGKTEKIKKKLTTFQLGSVADFFKEIYKKLW